MTRFNLSIKILTVMLLITAIAIFAQRTRACSSCDARRIMLSQNDQNRNSMNMKNMNMNNMNTNNMNTSNMNMNNRARPPRIPRGYALSPVSHMQVRITKDTPYTIYGDRKYYFASDQEKKEFLQDPQKYMNSMLPGKNNILPPTKAE